MIDLSFTSFHPGYFLFCLFLFCIVCVLFWIVCVVVSRF